ncbi:MAG: PLP-dependent aminotransferase family protein [Myxococcales bacterium]
MKLGLSTRMSLVKASAIREILKVTERPDILSFAGGLPAPESFPVDAIAQAHERVFTTEARLALQYGTTEGFTPLRAWIAERLRGRGMACTAEDVIITSGSQQGIDLTAKILLDAGDTVIVENPSYLAALQVFSGYEARIATVGSDDEGMRTSELARVIAETRAKLIYVNPTFQNPKGTTLSLERRIELVRVAREFGVAVLEDEPYAELRYAGSPLPPLAAIDREAPVIHLGTFSKTLAPGLRIAWAVAAPETVHALTVAKQAADLHTNTLSQRAVARMLETFDYEVHLTRIRTLYSERCRAMRSAVAASFPKGTRCTDPAGGLFLWASIPDMDADELFDDAIREKVAFVPGAPFFARTPDRSSLRLNFSNRPPDLIAEGIARLGRAAAKRVGAVQLRAS